MTVEQGGTPLPFDIPSTMIREVLSDWEEIKDAPEYGVAGLEELEGTDRLFVWYILNNAEPSVPSLATASAQDHSMYYMFLKGAVFARRQLEKTVGGIAPLDMGVLERFGSELYGKDLIDTAEINSPNLDGVMRTIARTLSGKDQIGFSNGYFTAYRIYFLNNQ